MRKDIYITPELYADFETLGDYLRTLDKALLDARGHELPNPEPLVLNIDMGQPMTLQEQIARLFRSEISKQAMSQDMETEAEANDFDIPGDNLDTNDDTKYKIMEEDYIDEETTPPGLQDPETPPASTEKEAPPLEPLPEEKPAANE